jgi:hypothetical protein
MSQLRGSVVAVFEHGCSVKNAGIQDAALSQMPDMPRRRR